MKGLGASSLKCIFAYANQSRLGLTSTCCYGDRSGHLLLSSGTRNSTGHEHGGACPDRSIKITENQIKHMLAYKAMFILFLFIFLYAACKHFWAGPISSFCL